jgi:hypothetical protein
MHYNGAITLRGTPSMRLETWFLGLAVGVAFGYISQLGRF